MTDDPIRAAKDAICYDLLIADWSNPTEDQVSELKAHLMEYSSYYRDNYDIDDNTDIQTLGHIVASDPIPIEKILSIQRYTKYEFMLTYGGPTIKLVFETDKEGYMECAYVKYIEYGTTKFDIPDDIAMKLWEQYSVLCINTGELNGEDDY